MKVALIGYGKMGKSIEKIAQALGVEVVARIASNAADIEWSAIAKADVCIDFSHPEAVLQHVRKVMEFHKPMVIGTSGWYENMDVVKSIGIDILSKYLYVI